MLPLTQVLEHCSQASAPRLRTTDLKTGACLKDEELHGRSGPAGPRAHAWRVVEVVDVESAEVACVCVWGGGPGTGRRLRG